MSAGNKGITFSKIKAYFESKTETSPDLSRLCWMVDVTELYASQCEHDIPVKLASVVPLSAYLSMETNISRHWWIEALVSAIQTDSLSPAYKTISGAVMRRTGKIEFAGFGIIDDMVGEPPERAFPIHNQTVPVQEQELITHVTLNGVVKFKRFPEAEIPEIAKHWRQLNKPSPYYYLQLLSGSDFNTLSTFIMPANTSTPMHSSGNDKQITRFDVRNLFRRR
uniref:U2 protein n=1 Tax=XiangYang Rhabdovirus 6 TaxID=3230308 RepID=A0AAU8BDE5_9RHAB